VKPIFVEGLPGFGNVGRVAARYLIEFAHARFFAELYSPFFPDFVIVNKSGICRPPRYEFYTASVNNKHLIILTGDSQPSLDDVVAHYELCGEILDFVEKCGCEFVVTIGGVPVANPEKNVYVAATSEKLAADYMEKGAVIYGKGRIMGATGLILGLAKNRGLDGACLLGATTGVRVDRSAGHNVFKFLMKILGVEIKTERVQQKK
jgi:hypothetical protein